MFIRVDLICTPYAVRHDQNGNDLGSGEGMEGGGGGGGGEEGQVGWRPGMK